MPKQEQEQTTERKTSATSDNKDDKMGASRIASCSNTKSTQESTTTLLSARALAKAGHSNCAWEEIEALLAAQRC